MDEDADNPWRETVRDLYDHLLLGSDFMPDLGDETMFNNRLAARLVWFIETRHPDFFGRPETRKAPLRGPG